MGTYSIRDARPGDAAAVRDVVTTVLREYGLAPDRAGVDADLDDLGASYAGRGGVFRVVVDGRGRVVGCGGLYPLDEREAEVRKMYLLPPARGHGLGLALLEGLVDEARRRGFAHVVLETASVLERAIALYRRFGFVPVEREHLAGRCDQAYVLALDAPGGVD